MSAAAILVACLGDEERPVFTQQTLGAGVSPLVFSPPAGAGGSGAPNVEPEPPTAEEIAAFTQGTANDFEIFVDPPATVSVYCGDGVADPDREECDDGPGGAVDLCSANCQTRDLLLVPFEENGAEQARKLGTGPHPLALVRVGDDSGRDGVGALSYVELGNPLLPVREVGSAPQVIVQLLDRWGNPRERVTVADASGASLEEGRPTSQANPVSVALPDGSVQVFYNDLNGDGSELGVGARTLTPTATGWELGALGFANQVAIGAQQDPDAIWTGSAVVVAWLDSSDPETGPDLRYRIWGDAAQSGVEQTLAATANPEGGVTLSPWTRSAGSGTSSGVEPGWAAVWRESLPDGSEAIGVRARETTFRLRVGLVGGVVAQLADDGTAPGSGGAVELFMPAGEGSRPRVAPLDDRHLALTWTVGTDPGGTSVATVERLLVGVLDTESGELAELDLLQPLRPGAPSTALGLSSNDPSLVAVTEPTAGGLPSGQVFLAWRTEGPTGDANGEDLWLKRLDWDGSVLSLAQVEVPLPRTTSGAGLDHDLADQRRPVLASLPVPGASALGIAWEDYGGTFGEEQAQPDIVLQVASVPLRRGAPVESSCAAGSCQAGQGPCTGDSDCAPGLACLDKGPAFGFGADTQVCAPASCDNGAQDGNETEVDCGGSCGQCFDCPGPEYAGTAHYCSAVCHCANLEGDCDADRDCRAGLSCVENSGAILDLPAPIDLCLVDHCVDGQLTADEERVDCGGLDCLACANGAPEFCVEQACTEGQGDCAESGASCTTGLVCQAGQAEIYGLPEDASVCVSPGCASGRGTPNTAGFCTSSCKCPDGLGLCTADNQCLSNRCAREVGLRFGLDAEDSVCMADHCFNGQQDVGETEVDCGGDCGTECPTCPEDSTLASFENRFLWGQPTWDSQGTILPISTNTSSPTATDGQSSLRMAHCDFREVHSIPLAGSEFAIVGDELLVDIRFQVGSGGYSWDWVGNFGLQIYSPRLGLFTLRADSSYNRSSANQWITLRMPVPAALRTELVNGEPGLNIRLRVNRSCYIAGASGGSISVDNLRFGGDAVFRSDCAPDDGGGGGSGGGGTGGGGGSGGGGSGGEPPTRTEEIFSMDDAADWTSAQATPVGNTDSTEGSGSIQIPAGSAVELVSSPISAAEIGTSDRLLIDLKLPKKIPSQQMSGSAAVYMTCPSINFFGQFAGQINFWDKPQKLWFSASLVVPQAFKNALATTATDCRITLRVEVYGNQGGVVLIDHLRFTGPSVCSNYTQVSSPPFSLGMPTAPTGTAASPWPLCSKSQLQYVMNNNSMWDEHFAVHANIDLTGATGQLGTASVPFSGSFDGQDNTLYSYSRSGGDDVGLFGVVQGDGNLDGVADGYVHDLIVSGFSVSGASRVGGLIGKLAGRAERVVSLQTAVTGSGTDVGGLFGLVETSAVASQCLSDGPVSGVAATNVGGLVGRNKGTLQSTASTAFVTLSGSGAGSNVGGLCGKNEALIQDGEANGDVQAAGGVVGGLVGDNRGDVVHCAARGAVGQSRTDKSRVGGLVGFQGTGTVERSLADGNVTNSGGQTGGLIGRLEGGAVTDTSSSGTTSGAAAVGGLIGQMETGSSVSRSYNRGAVTGSSLTGRLVGDVNAGTFSQCLTSSTANPTRPNVGEGSSTGITAVSASQLLQQSTYTGFDFTNVWIMGSQGAALR